MKIVFASSNAGKIHELQALLSDYDIEIIPQTELNVTDADETGSTFVENAIIKARHACKVTCMPALADDSGLAVASLDGRPGIYSARYAGVKADAKDNIKKLLQEMQGLPAPARGAAFHCVLVFMLHELDPVPLICHGVWHGSILLENQGENGFGYDPVFYIKEENCSAAQLALNVKNQLSHRGQALRQLLQALPQKLPVRTHQEKKLC